MSEVAVKKESAAPTRLSEWFWPALRRRRSWGRRSWGQSPSSMLREIADAMEGIFQGLGPGPELQAWAPAIDVQQCNGTLTISAELPGLKKEDVKVEVVEDVVVIEGERKQEHEEDHDGFHRWERSYGRFYRSIPLPEGAKTDQAKAEMKEGVLKISIPAPEPAKKSHRISIG